MAGMSERDKRIAKAKALYPETWGRVNAVCVYFSSLVDAEDHVARVVLACCEGAL